MNRLFVISAAIIICAAIALSYANRKAKQMVVASAAPSAGASGGAANTPPAAAPKAIGYGLTFALADGSKLANDVVQLDCNSEPKVLDRPHKEACNPFQGDTSCRTVLPVLCSKPGNFPAPTSSEPGLYPAWMGGSLGATQPVMGAVLESEAMASAMCQRELGEGWRMAEFSDNGGRWAMQGQRGLGLGGNNRYWVLASGQAANCWNSTP